MARELEAHNDETIDFVFKMKKPEMMLEQEIREAFLLFMVQILSGYKSYLLPIKSAPKVGATDVNNLFDQNSFLASRDKNYHKFYHLLMQTQMFTKFIEERSFVSETNTALAFFDECMEHPDRRFLELDFPDSDRTVFIMPPDTSGLPPGQEYKSEKFEELNPELFEDKSDHKSEVDNNVLNEANIFATPVSAIARRTKQEIKSAQKSAKKVVDSPFMWAKCLVNTSYSLWFIHLPAFMTSNKAITELKALKLAIVILQRMRRLRLYPIEEICFRVLLQLCGVYHRPQMAMEVMNEMNLMGMSPNAVTYGYYNKAVLESVWPQPEDPSRAMKSWHKLTLVLEIIRRFRQCGREAQTVNSFSRERQEKLQQKNNQNGGSKSELDNISRSSQDSEVSKELTNNVNETTPVTAPKRYTDIRGRFSNLLGNSSQKNVNRVLFEQKSNETPDIEVDGVEPLKSRSTSIDSSDSLGMMMGEPVTKEDLKLPLPTVNEQKENLLTPPEMKKVASSASIKLMGVPVTEDDPLGALSANTSPTMQKSATASELLVNNKRPSLQENILGSPFSTSSMEMSRSSTMPLNENEDNKGYFSMASIKSMTKTGTTRLSTLKKSGLASASSWMSPNSKESLNKGISSLRNVYSTATTSISKRVEELQNTRNLNETNSNSNPNLENTEDTVSLNSNSERKTSETAIDQPDSWSNFTGQIWDQLWSYSTTNSQVSNLPPQNIKNFSDLFEELYERMPRKICGAVAMELRMTSCSRCKNCGLILYDEEIISGWSAEDSNLNTKCAFCGKMVVPHLTIKVVDLRVEESEAEKSVIETPIQVSVNFARILLNLTI